MAGFGALWGDIGGALPEAYGASAPVLDPLVAVPKRMLWDLPKEAVEAAKNAPLPGLRREDFTDSPEYGAPDPKSIFGRLGIPAPTIAPGPMTPLVAATTEAASNVMGAGASFVKPGTLGAGGGRMMQSVAAPERAAVEARAAEPAYPSWHDAMKGTLDESRPAAATAAEPAAAANTGQLGSGGGGPLGARSLDEAQAAAARWAGERKPLEGLPGALKIGEDHFVPGPIGQIHDVAEAYMREHHPDRPYTQPSKYHPLDPEHSKAIAQAYEDMPHTPDDPATKASYEALIDETAKQYQAIKKTGLKIEPIPAGSEDPYAASPRLAARDVAENNHLWFFPTEGGFGTVNKIADNPMLRNTGETIGEHPLLANDMFRIVHDYFGYLKEGHGFRSGGEDNAWRTHSAMYSDIARPAMTTETRGQNSWVNYGPHGEKNRKASAADTTYADQKVGLLPEWVMRDRGSPDPIIAYHGTPHSFDRFNVQQVGAGEGNQAYGHGLYFAENEPVSEWYRHQLAARRDPILQRYGLTSQDGADVGMALASRKGDNTAAAASFRKYAESLRAEGRDDAATTNMIRRAEAKASYLEDADRSKGHMYQVAIDANPEHFLDWDAALNGEQQAKVRAAAQEIRPSLYERTMGVGRDLNKHSITENLEGKTGEQVIAMLKRGLRSDSDASKALQKAGIVGIKYLDEGSRGITGKSTRNYVTFDDKMVRILKKYGIAGLPAGAAGFGSMVPREDH